MRRGIDRSGGAMRHVCSTKSREIQSCQSADFYMPCGELPNGFVHETSLRKNRGDASETLPLTGMRCTRPTNCGSIFCNIFVGSATWTPQSVKRRHASSHPRTVRTRVTARDVRRWSQLFGFCPATVTVLRRPTDKVVLFVLVLMPHYLF